MSDTTTPEERRTAERERVASACRALLSSEGWRGWVRARSTFHSYSLYNQLLIALQAPNATRVAGFHTWRTLGRQVRKGEKSIRILAPILPRRTEAKTKQATTARAQDSEAKEPKRSVVGYRSVGVFDLAQTDPMPGAEPLPLAPPCAPITGDTHSHLLPKLAEHAVSLNYALRYEKRHGCDGYCDHAQQLIVVSSDLAPNAQVRVLIHELCHAHGADYKTYGRAACEVIVDCATHISCATLGLDVSGETIPYIAGWGEAEDALTAVTRFAGIIDGLAARIEAAVS